MLHNKLTFTAEYCRARRIPYRIANEALFINRLQVCYSLYNLTYVDIIKMIDDFCVYDATSTFYKGVKTMVHSNSFPSVHNDNWGFQDENAKHYRNIRRFASRLLDVPYEDITVERFSIDDDGLYEATVSIPYMDGYTTEHIHEYHN